MDDKKSFQDEALDVAQTVSQLLFGISYAAKEHQMKGQAPDVVNEIINTIRSAYTEPFSLSVISKKYYLSVEHIIRIFKQATGETPYHYYRKYKLVQAEQMLIYSDTAIKEIALTLGYTHTASFCSQFKKMFGVSPSEYRRSNKVYQN